MRGILRIRVDSWILFFLLVGLLTPELFRLVLEEIGSKPKRTGRQRGAIVGLILRGARLSRAVSFAHQRAIALLDGRVYRGQVPLEVAAFPRPSNPLLWSGVVETDNALFKLEVPLGPGPEFDPELAEVYFKPEASLTLRNAIASSTAVEFLKFRAISARARRTRRRRLPGSSARHALCVRTGRPARNHRRHSPERAKPRDRRATGIRFRVGRASACLGFRYCHAGESQKLTG